MTKRSETARHFYGERWTPPSLHEPSGPAEQPRTAHRIPQGWQPPQRVSTERYNKPGVVGVEPPVGHIARIKKTLTDRFYDIVDPLTETRQRRVAMMTLFAVAASGAGYKAYEAYSEDVTLAVESVAMRTGLAAVNEEVFTLPSCDEVMGTVRLEETRAQILLYTQMKSGESGFFEDQLDILMRPLPVTLPGDPQPEIPEGETAPVVERMAVTRHIGNIAFAFCFTGDDEHKKAVVDRDGKTITLDVSNFSMVGIPGGATGAYKEQMAYDMAPYAIVQGKEEQSLITLEEAARLSAFLVPENPTIYDLTYAETLKGIEKDPTCWQALKDKALNSLEEHISSQTDEEIKFNYKATGFTPASEHFSKLHTELANPEQTGVMLVNATTTCSVEKEEKKS